MKYEKPDMWIIVLEDSDIVTGSGQIEVGDPFDDTDNGGLPVD